MSIEVKSITNTSSITKDFYESLGLVIGALMNDYPVAVQSWGNTTSVTEFHWVTVTAADISVFDIKELTVNYSSWGVLYDGDDAYKWSDVWGMYEGGESVGKASIVIIEI